MEIKRDYQFEYDLLIESWNGTTACKPYRSPSESRNSERWWSRDATAELPSGILHACLLANRAIRALDTLLTDGMGQAIDELIADAKVANEDVQEGRSIAACRETARLSA